MIDLAGAKPVAMPEHLRPVVVMTAVEEYELLKVFEIGHVDSRPSTSGTAEDSLGSRSHFTPGSGRVRQTPKKSESQRWR